MILILNILSIILIIATFIANPEAGGLFLLVYLLIYLPFKIGKSLFVRIKNGIKTRRELAAVKEKEAYEKYFDSLSISDFFSIEEQNGALSYRWNPPQKYKDDDLQICITGEWPMTVVRTEDDKQESVDPAVFSERGCRIHISLVGHYFQKKIFDIGVGLVKGGRFIAQILNDKAWVMPRRGEIVAVLKRDEDTLKKCRYEVECLRQRVKEQQLEKERKEIEKKIIARQKRKELEKDVRQKLIDDGVLFGEQTKRPPIPREVVDAVYRRDGGRCVYCGSTEELQLDHIIPFSVGGATNVENLQLLCRSCNVKKSNKIG